jgi:DNA mismatch endonuclease (patch repair protein)
MTKRNEILRPDDAVSRRMKATLGRDNTRERELRSCLHRLGLRFRVHRRLLPGTSRTVDVVLPASRIAVFIDGCFWHGCPNHGTWPRRNAAWWRAKIRENRKRDHDTDLRLKADGWWVVRVWEHEPAGIAANRIRRIAIARQTQFNGE